MRLKSLYIHNYKSFYHTTIEFDKFNIIIGENNSGKSNILDVLEFVNIIRTKSFDEAIKLKGGFEKILNYNYDEKKIVIELEIEYKDFIGKLRVTVYKNINIKSSIIYAKNKKLPLGIYGTRYNSKYNSKVDKKIEKNIKINDINLLFINIIFFGTVFKISKNYAFNTETIRQNSHKEAREELEKNGENLGKVLFEIKEKHPNTFDIISNSMIGIVNEIEGISIQKSIESYNIGFREKHREIGINTVSDGTINLLATITALNQNDMNDILAFDEPERYLHIKAINYLLDSFRDSEKQILITTHSTQILKDVNLDEVIFVYRDIDGDTQTIKASNIPNLEEKMKRLAYDRPLGLDELINDGIIGDFE